MNSTAPSNSQTTETNIINPQPKKTLISFLGTGTYRETNYTFADEQKYTCCYSAAALAKKLQPAVLLSFQTPEAHQIHGQNFQDAIHVASSQTQVHPVEIPLGSTTDEIWKIFDAITSNTPIQHEVHFDITHGLRSLPLLALLALSYLRITQNITIGGLYYAAFEARNTTTNTTSIFDLTPFLALLEWTSAADLFLKTGNATPLTQILKEIQKLLHKAPTPNQKTPPLYISSIAKQMEECALDLTLLRTRHLKDSLQKFKRNFQQYNNVFAEIYAHAKPFLLLFEPVKKSLTEFSDQHLQHLLDWCHWLIERGHIQACFTLQREFLIDWAATLLGFDPQTLSQELRKNISTSLTSIITEKPIDDSASAEANQYRDALLTKLTKAQIAALQSKGSQITQCRNDLNHAGYNPDMRDSRYLTTTAQTTLSSLQQLLQETIPTPTSRDIQ